MGDTTDAERVRARLSDIDDRLSELADATEFAASSDAQYRMIDAEREGLKTERAKLKEILGDL